MIVRESRNHFTMISQHDHAILSGEIAKYFNPHLFIHQAYKEDTLFAIREHDRGWIRLDETPLWNDRDKVPYSFMNYPLYPKLPMYTIGINEVEERNSYAALLCSLHYSSFHHLRESTNPDCIEFIQNEASRQSRLNKQLGFPKQEMVYHHLQLLKLCDEISLYVCLNKEGASKEEEHPWYRDGFKRKIEDQTITAYWVSPKEIKLKPFPFISDFQVVLRKKHVPKELRSRIGIERAYKETKVSELKLIFSS